MTARASGERSATMSVFFSITQLHALALAVNKSPADFYFSTPLARLPRLRRRSFGSSHNPPSVEEKERGVTKP